MSHRLDKKMKEMQASLWLKLQALLDVDEMESLFNAMGSFSIYITAGAVEAGTGEISKEKFLTKYRSYIEVLKQGKVPDLSDYSVPFASVFTTKKEALYTIELANGKELNRISEPVIQLQPLQVSYSKEEKKFRAMVFGKNSISWGIQFSFPQLFENPETKEVVQTLKDKITNAELFKKLQKWFRQHTRPTPFQVDGQKIVAPFRLGDHCLSWIHQHPQLKNLEIITS